MFIAWPGIARPAGAALFAADLPDYAAPYRAAATTTKRIWKYI